MTKHTVLIVNVGQPAVLLGCKSLILDDTSILVHVLGNLTIGGLEGEWRRQNGEVGEENLKS